MTIDFTANFISSFSIVYKCWKASPEDRPAFEELSASLIAKLESVAGYLELNMVLEPQGKFLLSATIDDSN